MYGANLRKGDIFSECNIEPFIDHEMVISIHVNFTSSDDDDGEHTRLEEGVKGEEEERSHS